MKKLAEKYNWPLWDQVFTFFFHRSFSSLLLIMGSVFVFLQPTKGLFFFFSLFFEQTSDLFYPQLFLRLIPFSTKCLLKHLSWTFSRLRMRQNKFALGNFILSTVFCGFHQHASRKIDASHIFLKKLNLQGSHNQNKSACLQSAVHRDGSRAALRMWVLLFFICGAGSAWQWETDQHWPLENLPRVHSVGKVCNVHNARTSVNVRVVTWI